MQEEKQKNQFFIFKEGIKRENELGNRADIDVDISTKKIKLEHSDNHCSDVEGIEHYLFNNIKQELLSEECDLSLVKDETNVIAEQIQRKQIYKEQHNDNIDNNTAFVPNQSTYANNLKTLNKQCPTFTTEELAMIAVALDDEEEEHRQKSQERT